MWWKILRRWFKQIWTRIQLWCKGMKSMSCSWNNKSLRRRKNNSSCYCMQMPWTSKEEGMTPMTAKEARPIASEAMPGRELRANSMSKAKIKNIINQKRTITRKRRRGLILISTALALLMRAVMQRPRGPRLSLFKAPANQSRMQFQHSSIKEGYR